MYVKLFSSIYKGTLRGRSHALLVFTNLLAHCDKEGIVDMHPKAISEEVGLSVDEVRAALLELEAPDTESRSYEEEGRRIVRLDGHRAWGWRVVNYLKYRAIRDEDDRREQNRRAQAAWRERNKPPSAAVSRDKPRSAHTEAEAEAEAGKTKSAATVNAAGSPGASPGNPTPPPDFDGTNAEVLNGKAVVALSVKFDLPEPWGVDAEALGWKPGEVMREGEKYRQYWTEGRGKGTRRSVKGWRQAWSNWLEKAAKDKR